MQPSCDLRASCLCKQKKPPGPSPFHAAGLETCASLEPLSLDLSALPGGVLPGPRRDSATCPAGPSCFAVLGGFDGSAEVMDMLVVEVSLACWGPCVPWLGDLPWCLAATPRHTLQVAPAPGSLQSLHAAGPGDPAPSLNKRLQGRVQWVEPRTGRSPRGRSHHSACYHAAGRSLIVFGGYSSAAAREAGSGSGVAGGASLGHLAELWVFNLDTQEWWMPEPVGECLGAGRVILEVSEMVQRHAVT